MIQKLKEVLATKGMREAGFPAKVSLPLYLGVFAAVTFDNCQVYEAGELEPELFLVDPNYGSSRRMRKVMSHLLTYCVSSRVCTMRLPPVFYHSIWFIFHFMLKIHASFCCSLFSFTFNYTSVVF